MEDMVNEASIIENKLTEQHMKEGISRAYVTAIAHFSGLNIEKPEYDYGIDGTFSGIKIRNNRHISNGVKLDFQLKASKNVTIEENIVKYNLESKTYNDLIDEDISTPRILILYKVPENKNDWINVSIEKTVLKDCAWWYYLRGEEPTSNTSTKTIEIPIDQVFDEKSLKLLMSRVERGELV